jgi:hypothetical protein
MEPAPIINKFSKVEIIIQNFMKLKKNQQCFIEKLLLVVIIIGIDNKERKRIFYIRNMKWKIH